MLKYFVCHASEDKDEVARPIAEALKRRGLKIWYDEYSLTLGDSLRRSINEGLHECDFAVVVLSPKFFSKEWPQHELDGLYSREIDEKRKLILPIWHQISSKEITEYSPLLAGKLGISTDRGFEVICDEILNASKERKEVKEMQEKLSTLYEDYYSEVYSAGADDGAGYDTMPTNQGAIAGYKRQIKELEEKLKPFTDHKGS